MTKAKEVIRLLLESGTNPNVRSDINYVLRDEGQLPIEVLLNKESSYNADLVKLLIDFGARTNVRRSYHEYGETILHKLAANGYTRYCELFISGGADVNAKDSQGDTPLYYARKSGRKKVASLLINHGASED